MYDHGVMESYMSEEDSLSMESQALKGSYHKRKVGSSPVLRERQGCDPVDTGFRFYAQQCGLLFSNLYQLQS